MTQRCRTTFQYALGSWLQCIIFLWQCGRVTQVSYVFLNLSKCSSSVQYLYGLSVILLRTLKQLMVSKMHSYQLALRMVVKDGYRFFFAEGILKQPFKKKDSVDVSENRTKVVLCKTIRFDQRAIFFLFSWKKLQIYGVNIHVNCKNSITHNPSKSYKSPWFSVMIGRNWFELFCIRVISKFWED